MAREKQIEKGLTGLDLELDIIKRLKEGKKVKGYCLCPTCNGSGWGEKPFEYCKVCHGVGLFNLRLLRR